MGTLACIIKLYPINTQMTPILKGGLESKSSASGPLIASLHTTGPMGFELTDQETN